MCVFEKFLDVTCMNEKISFRFVRQRLQSAIVNMFEDAQF